ncbi:hypothetical protein ACFYTC_18540 [Actinomadura nitritigenes]
MTRTWVVGVSVTGMPLDHLPTGLPSPALPAPAEIAGKLGLW